VPDTFALLVAKLLFPGYDECQESFMDFFKNLGFSLVLAGAVLLAACGSTPQFADVWDREWKLAAVRTVPENIILDRNQLIVGGFEDVFTIRFADMASGTNSVSVTPAFPAKPGSVEAPKGVSSGAFFTEADTPLPARDSKNPGLRHHRYKPARGNPFIKPSVLEQNC
jgi:hypothetical protein